MSLLTLYLQGGGAPLHALRNQPRENVPFVARCLF
jgi:hypothetical protein